MGGACTILLVACTLLYMTSGISAFCTCWYYFYHYQETLCSANLLFKGKVVEDLFKNPHNFDYYSHPDMWRRYKVRIINVFKDTKRKLTKGQKMVTVKTNAWEDNCGRKLSVGEFYMFDALTFSECDTAPLSYKKAGPKAFKPSKVRSHLNNCKCNTVACEVFDGTNYIYVSSVYAYSYYGFLTECPVEDKKYCTFDIDGKDKDCYKSYGVCKHTPDGCVWVKNKHFKKCVEALK